MAHGKYWHTMTKAQQQACLRLFNRQSEMIDPVDESYLAFRRRFIKIGASYDPYYIGPWCGMFIGIELDGYTHS